jgi:hypothetical protein
MIPFNEGEDVTNLLAHLETSLDTDGNANASIGNTTIMLSTEGKWKISRK